MTTCTLYYAQRLGPGADAQWMTVGPFTTMRAAKAALRSLACGGDRVRVVSAAALVVNEWRFDAQASRKG